MGSIAVGDFNSDGIHDLILGTAVLLAPVSGCWWAMAMQRSSRPWSVSVGTTGASFAIGLLSGDGRPDIAVGGCSVTALIAAS